MNTPSTIKKWLDLRGMAVVALTEGKKVGTFEDFYFEPTTHLIYALGVKTGFMGHKILPVAQISTVGEDAITTASEEDLQDKSADEKLSTMLPAEILRSYKVMGASGTLVGTLGNILIDVSVPTQLHVTGFELSGGLRERITGKYDIFTIGQVLSYGRDVLIISDEEAKELSQ